MPTNLKGLVTSLLRSTKDSASSDREIFTKLAYGEGDGGTGTGTGSRGRGVEDGDGGFVDDTSSLRGMPCLGLTLKLL